jgi:DNA-directed RNA polymerase specialized sigma24 family protein
MTLATYTCGLESMVYDRARQVDETPSAPRGPFEYDLLRVDRVDSRGTYVTMMYDGSIKPVSIEAPSCPAVHDTSLKAGNTESGAPTGFVVHPSPVAREDTIRCLGTIPYDRLGECLPNRRDLFTHMYRHLKEPVRRYVRRMGDGFGRREEEDLTQEIFCDFWVALERHADHLEKPVNYLWTAAHGHVVNANKRRERCPVVTAGDLRDEIDFHLTAADGRSLDALDPDERDRIRACIRWKLHVLTGKRRVVAEVYVENVDKFRPRDTYRQLAALVSERTGEPECVETIKSTWHAARKILQEELAHTWPEVFGQGPPSAS